MVVLLYFPVSINLIISFSTALIKIYHVRLFVILSPLKSEDNETSNARCLRG